MGSSTMGAPPTNPGREASSREALGGADRAALKTLLRADARVLPSAARALFVGVGLLPWVLPLLRAWLPLGAAGVGLDAAFVTMCHRNPERTLVLAGVLMPLCSRCAGIFGGVAVGALAIWPRLPARAWRLVVTGAGALMLVDVATQDLGLHPIWHVTRIASGALFGYAIAAACVLALRREAAGSLADS
jgi:uncharacterized membrane protein